jgi:hypothetical protein
MGDIVQIWGCACPRETAHRRILRERDGGSLTHDDRIDAVAGAVADFQRAMMMDVDQAAKAMRDEEMLRRSRTSSRASISRPIEACGSDGVRVHTWSSQHGWSGL